ncbi:bromodomain-containing protein 9 isoform X12 [Manis pentadactyla]|uniref:bromodomain-containing protein 9 isoform X12 n=1 Tax=Manis pentadactyla TaxID=143292 RepID=UPI00255C96B3|nr:bromodomain-containing protein 9 isoform X12 [Manis pentadactyla]
MGKKHKKHKAEWRSSYEDYVDKPLEKPLKLVLKVGGSEVTELSGSGHDSSYYDDRSDHERERHKEKKKKKKKKSEKEKHLDDEERRKRKEERKRKRDKEPCDSEGDTGDFDPGKKVEVEPPPDRPIRACRTQSADLWGPELRLVCLCAQSLLEAKPLRTWNRETHTVRSELSSAVTPKPCYSALLFYFELSAENESTPIQQLLEHFLRQLQRKDPHGFFAFPVTDAIAPGYSMIIKHPMDFGTMKDKIVANEYKSVTEFKADFKLMCDNAMTYNRPDTVYYKLAKKILHAGFKMMSKERLFALKRSMSFMQDVDFSQQAALLGNEDTAVEEPIPEAAPVQVETARKCKRPSREAISCMFEPEGNACSLTDSTAEEHVLALVEHAADEARDRISRLLPGSKRRNVPAKPPDEVRAGDSLGEGSSVLDFMSVKSYSDVSLDISMLGSLGKVKKELDPDDSHLTLDETARLLQDLHEAQAERGGSRPPSNLSSLSNPSPSDREQRHLGSPSRLSVGPGTLLEWSPGWELPAPGVLADGSPSCSSCGLHASPGCLQLCHHCGNAGAADGSPRKPQRMGKLALPPHLS